MKKVVLLSGGIDSTTCLAQAVQVCGAENVTALCVFTGRSTAGKWQQPVRLRLIMVYVYWSRILPASCPIVIAHCWQPAVKPSNIKLRAAAG